MIARSVPNFERYNRRRGPPAARDRPRRGDRSVLSGELRRYTRDGLRQLLTSAGFEMVRITYTNAMLFLPMAAGRAWQRWRGLSSEAGGGREISVPPAPVNLALASLL